ncbi:MAG: twin-arginine translocase subunit TatC [Dehalococcoidia bacterium]
MSIEAAGPQEPTLHAVPVREGGPEMTLVEHLLELRGRAIKSAVALALGLIFCAFFWETILGWLVAPARQDFPDFRLASFSPVDRIGIIFKIILYGGLIVSSPIILYQVLAFVLPGLTPREKKMLAPGVIGGLVFLAGGMAFAYWIILPASLGFLLGIGDENFNNVTGGKEYIDFVTRIVFWVGIAFEMPIVIALIARLGVVRARQLLGFWRYAIVIVALIAAFITPTPDPLNMSLVMGPLFGLYFVGILFAWIVQRPKTPETQTA